MRTTASEKQDIAEVKELLKNKNIKETDAIIVETMRYMTQDNKGDVRLYHAINSKLVMLSRVIDKMTVDIDDDDQFSKLMKLSGELKKISENLNHFRTTHSDPLPVPQEAERPRIGPEDFLSGK